MMNEGNVAICQHKNLEHIIFQLVLGRPMRKMPQKYSGLQYTLIYLYIYTLIYRH
jgi:hypothetical protein